MSLYSESWQQRLTAFEAYLQTAMPAVDTPQKTVSEAMAYACAAGGKRLRPMLLMEFASLCGGNTESVLPYAAAIEMIHCYSLVHDDLPCMDNSLLRRGQPSAFAKYGEDMALLAGDGLLTRAFECGLSSENIRNVGVDRAVAAMSLLADAAGIDGMVGGQTIDLESEGRQIDLYMLQLLQQKKTGALIMAACEMGAVLGGADGRLCRAARRYGEELGLAFQIVDDILDVTSTPEVLGKPVGADGDNQKVTYVSLLGLEQARVFADEHTNAALDALDVFGGAADELRQLTKRLLSRLV